MHTQHHDHNLNDLAEALGDLRDSLTLINMALKDYLADTSSPARDEVRKLVELQLARIQIAAR